MKIPDLVILSLAIVFLIIGIDQVIVLGLASAYWALMIALILFFVFNLRRRKTK
jgi:hypothetical protein